MKVIAINGSARKSGNTAIMLNTVMDELHKDGIESSMIQLAGNPVYGCRACYRCRELLNQKCVIEDDIVNEIIGQMIGADGILLGSPTYFADITSEMKALIDRAGFVSRGNGYLFRRKVGAAVVAVRRGGSIHAFDSMNHLFTISQMIIIGSTYWNMGFGGKKGEVESDEEGLQTMQDLGKNMAWAMKRLYGQ